MAIEVPTAAQLAVGSFNATSTSNQVDWGVEYGTENITTWGSGQFEEHCRTLGTLNVSFGGFNDYAAGAWDEFSRTNVGSAQVITLAPTGATASSLAVVGYGLMPAKQQFNANVGAVPAINASIIGSLVSPPLGEGLITRASSSNITATTNTTAVQVGALAATQTVVAAIHVFAYSGTGTITCQLQSSSTSGGSYTNRGSAGAALSAAGGQWISATGLTVTDTWWRLAVTASASPVATVLASIAIITP